MTGQIAPENYGIKPSHIDTSRWFMGAFNKLGVETLANAIVRLFQGKDYWFSFAKEELQFTCDANGANIAFLQRLIDDEYIVVDKSDRYCVTIKFIKKCHEASPAR